MEGIEAHRGSSDFFDKPLVLFDPVVQILDLEYFNKNYPTGKQQQQINVLQSGQVGAAFVHHGFFREPFAINGLPEEGGGGCFVAMFGEHEVNGVAEFIHGPIQGKPLRL